MSTAMTTRAIMPSAKAWITDLSYRCMPYAISALCWYLVCMLPITFIMYTSPDYGIIPITVYTMITAVIAASLLLDTHSIAARGVGNMAFLCPFACGVLALASLYMDHGGPTALKTTIYMAQTHLSMPLTTSATRDDVHIVYTTAQHRTYTIPARIDPESDHRINPEDFRHGVHITPVGFAAGSRTQTILLDYISDARHIIVRIEGGHNATVHADMSVAYFHELSMATQRDTDAVHTPKAHAEPTPLTDGMQPIR